MANHPRKVGTSKKTIMSKLPFLLAVALATAAAAQSPTAATLAHKVDAHYNHLQSLTAHFTERYQGMGIDRTETGTLTLRKPGCMRWAYDSGSSAAPRTGRT